MIETLFRIDMFGGNRFIDSFPRPIHWLRASSYAWPKGTLLEYPSPNPRPMNWPRERIDKSIPSKPASHLA
jgi:hypothetical protein